MPDTPPGNAAHRWLLLAMWMGIVGTALQLLALYVAPVAGDYRRGFWLEIIGSVMGSWAWRIWKAAKWPNRPSLSRGSVARGRHG